ncbi:MAG: hypothetical protein M3388_02985 [Acidobacteriota bacterium]|nr:hypothetical protein [Acidobacteriota bacterium]
MEKNKWFWFFFWLMGGASMAGQAAHYFIGGATYRKFFVERFSGCHPTYRGYRNCFLRLEEIPNAG